MGANTFLNDVWKAVKITFSEFQAGPKKKIVRSRKKPLWVKLKREKGERRPYEGVPVQKASVRDLKTKLEKMPPAVKREIIVERAVLMKSEPLQLWEEEIDKHDSGINAKIEPAQERVKSVISEQAMKVVRKNRQFYETVLSGPRKHLLFMNPGTEKIHEALFAIRTGNALPKWAVPFQDQLAVKGEFVDEKDEEKMGVAPEQQQLLFENLPMATTEEKREVVKRLYFDPKGPSTILPICDEFREKYANISRGNVRNILRSLETYQRNFARRRPPKIMGRMSMKKPGIIAVDMFFPTKKIAGWEHGWNCLTCMDCWSRFCHVYVTETKKKEVIRKCFDDFLQKLAAFGWMPRRILADRGTDLSSAKQAIEKYRTAKDGNQAMVVHSQTAQPINIVESFNSQIQRRMQVFRTSGLTDDPSRLLEDISFALNNQKRPGRGNLTPLQLLSLNEEEVKRVNLMFDDVLKEVPEIKGLKKLSVGDTVRVLTMTRKEQAANTIKGFTAKWSKDTFKVLKKTPIPKNKLNFRYWVGLGKAYFRHELLRIPARVDREVIDLVATKQTVVVGSDEEWSDMESEYDPDEYSD
jgi:hypothetical protein